MPARYTPVVNRPDLVERAERELGLRDARARHLEGRWMVQGRNGRGELRLFHPARRGWEEVGVDAGWDFEGELDRALEAIALGSGFEAQGKLWP